MGRVRKVGGTSPAAVNETVRAAAAAMLAPSSFAAQVEDFKRRFPEEWEACRLWPTESGLSHMIDKLKG